MSASSDVDEQASSDQDELQLIATIQDPMLKERFLNMMMMKARYNMSTAIITAMIKAAKHQDPHVRTAAEGVTNVLAMALEDVDPSVRSPTAVTRKHVTQLQATCPKGSQDSALTIGWILFGSDLTITIRKSSWPRSMRSQHPLDA
eukprot:748400-Hanusia_phi.AAC.16